MPDGRTFLRKAALSTQGRANVQARIAKHWPGPLSATQRAEAVAVESAVEILNSRNYRVLYVGRPGPVPGTTTHVSKGPDIVAFNPTTNRTVVVEAKGAVGDLSINNTRLKSQVVGQRRFQPSRDWLQADANNRYLDTLRTGNSDVSEAAARLQRIIDGVDDYDAVVVAASPKASLGKVDDLIEELHGDPGVSAELITLAITVP